MGRDCSVGEKEAFKQLFAQEMVSSLLGNSNTQDDDEDEDVTMKNLQEKLKEKQGVRKKVKRRSSASKKTKGRKDRDHSGHQSSEVSAEDLENMFYAQMTGELVSSVHDSSEYKKRQVCVYEEKVADSDGDNDSFAGGCLDDLVIPSTSFSSRGECRSSMSVSSRSGSGSHSSSDRSCTSASSGGLDVDAIREFVMKSIPQAVRDQIPESAWGQIFAPEGTNGSESKSATNHTDSGTPVSAIDTEIIVDDDDAVSEISVSTGFNIAFPDGKRVEAKRATAFDMEGEENVCYEHSDIVSQEGTRDTMSSNSEGPSEDFMPAPGRNSLASKSATPSAKTGPKKVGFNYVYLRHYERILTDNPAVQSGPAIGIGWRYKRGCCFDVDEFEQCRGLPRRSDELILSRTTRENILRGCGYNQKDIADMVRVILKAKNQRKTTVNNLSSQGMEETVENARKTVKRLLTFGMSKDIL